MANHKKAPRTALVNRANRPLVIFGLPGGQGGQYCPFHVPAGALFGRDACGYWVFTYPSSEWRRVETLPIWRFDLEEYIWVETRERGTELTRKIREHLSPMDRDDFAALARVPRKCKTGTLKRAEKHRLDERLAKIQKAAHVKSAINPAEMAWSDLRDPAPRRPDSF